MHVLELSMEVKRLHALNPDLVAPPRQRIVAMG
jgi:hypothetical protein